jgi:predicted nucleic acid-binding protein
VIVVDSNVLAARNMDHEKSAFAQQVERRDPVWIVPALWRYEFQNILAKAIRTKRLTVDAAVETWREVMIRMAENEHDPSAERIIDLAGRYRITAYDANFVALAMEMGVLCVTEDRKLHENFPAVAVSMEDFIKQDTGENLVRETKASHQAHRKRKR